MAPPSHEISDFKRQLRASMEGSDPTFTTIRVGKHENIYAIGDEAGLIYFIESGQIKLLTLSPEGKECLLDIHVAGDTFGELCLAESAPRQETATAMVKTTLKGIHCGAFFSHLADHSLVEGFVQYLAMRVAEQQQVIARLITVDSEHRLGETLITLARKLGKQDPHSKRIEQRITHEELSQMVGTTRPRITEFMRKFRSLGLISFNAEHALVIDEKKLASFLDHV